MFSGTILCYGFLRSVWLTVVGEKSLFFLGLVLIDFFVQCCFHPFVLCFSTSSSWRIFVWISVTSIDEYVSCWYKIIFMTDTQYFARKIEASFGARTKDC